MAWHSIHFLRLLAAVPVAVALSAAAVAENATAGVAEGPELSAAQIVEKNVAARGGSEAWRKVQSMAWAGRVRSATAQSDLPFVMELKRPNKTHFAVKGMKGSSLRVFDGSQGWKVQPSANGIPEAKPFAAEELQFSRDAQSIDGPLIDHEAKGVTISLEGIDQVEGRKAYRLNVRLASGAVQHFWIDAETFLEIKSDRVGRNAAGLAAPVTIFYRDHRAFEGLILPVLIETGVGSGKTPDRMFIDKISINPALDDRAFERPRLPGTSRHSVTVRALPETPAPSARRAP